VLPDDHRVVLTYLGYGIPILELVILGYLAVSVRRMFRSWRTYTQAVPDVYDRLRLVIWEVFKLPAIMGVLAYELSVFYYAFSLRRGPSPEHSYSYLTRSGYGPVAAAIVMAAALELTGGYFLLRLWSGTAALIHSGLSVYALLWLMGDYRAMNRRRHEILKDRIRLRCGLRWDLSVHFDDVECIERVPKGRTPHGCFTMTPIGEPTHLIRFVSPVTAVGPYGWTRNVELVGIVVDDSDAFERGSKEAGLPVLA